MVLICLSLPLYEEHSCALGIITMNYLDELCGSNQPTSEDTRQEIKIKSQEWVPHSDVAGSLEDAFHLWDAVSEVQGTPRFISTRLTVLLGLRRNYGCW